MISRTVVRRIRRAAVRVGTHTRSDTLVQQ